MSEPASFEAYRAKFDGNQRLSGHGPNTTAHSACPWCAEPDFSAIRVLDSKAEMVRERTCRHCHRSGVWLAYRIAHGMEFEFMQTGGPAAPEWMGSAAPRLLDPLHPPSKAVGQWRMRLQGGQG